MTRRDEILKLIVEHFVKTAEPVGSKTLQEVYHLSVSSATIRNEMNALENDGYLEKTHTSSGRVPSQKAYKYYVEHIRTGNVDSSAKNALANILSEKTKSVEEVMKESCEILSHMTNLASVVLGPSVQQERLAKVQLIPLSKNSATAVFVTDQGYVENKTFIVDEKLHMEDVEKMVGALNDRLKGTPVSEVVPKMEALRPALTDYMVEQKVIYQALLEAFVKFSGDRMMLYGKDTLFDQPEFTSDANKLKKVLELLDNPTALRAAVNGGEKTGSGVAVKIGNEKDGMDDVAIVSTNLSIPGSPCLTVLGPSRMDYEKVVSTLKYFAETLDHYFAGEAKGDNEICQTTKSTKKSPGIVTPSHKTKKK
jgi:heat-inducible transcriptional repressor